MFFVKRKTLEVPPSVGAIRIYTKFVWWPKALHYEWAGEYVRKIVWLERAHFYEQYLSQNGLNGLGVQPYVWILRDIQPIQHGETEPPPSRIC